MLNRKNKKQRINTVSFEVPVNSRIYNVSATPFTVATGDTLYRVSYNNGPVHIFAWDEGLERYAESDPMAEVIPPIIEMAIAGKLHNVTAQMQHAA